MGKSTNLIRDSADLIADDETWINILEPEFCKDSAAVESLAQLLFIIREEINSGPKGVIKASKILSNGIDIMYLYTNAHKAALKLYLLSLKGELKPQDEPLNLINAAIKRGEIKRQSWTGLYLQTPLTCRPVCPPQAGRNPARAGKTYGSIDERTQGEKCK